MRGVLDEAQCAVIEAVKRAKQAWVPADELARRFGAGVVESLVPRWLARWDRPDYPALTLTPWAAEAEHVDIVEHWRFHGHRGGDAPVIEVPSGCAAEVPVWREYDPTQGHPVPGLINLPRFARGVSIPYPDRVPEPRRRVYARDPVSDDDLVIFGQKVEVDFRLKPGRPAKPKRTPPGPVAGRPAKTKRA